MKSKSVGISQRFYFASALSFTPLFTPSLSTEVTCIDDTLISAYYMHVMKGADTMRHSFNVLDDPWIPVTLLNGITKDVNMRDAFYLADEIESVRGDNPLQKTAVIRLLTAFITDAYFYGGKISTRADRYALFKSGHFDRKLIEMYINHCMADCGASFDLLDEKRPFMSQAKDSKIDKDPDPNVKRTRGDESAGMKSAISFVVHATKGNNTLHWSHEGEADFAGLSYQDTLLNMLEQYLFAYSNRAYPTASLVQLGSSFYIPEDKDLFHTLVRCMRSSEELGKLPISSPKAPCAWNDSRTLVPGQPVAEKSFCFAMTFEPRRIVLIPEEDNIIRRCYFAAGWAKDKSDTTWFDPFVAYRKPAGNKKIGKANADFRPCRMDPNRELWRDVGNITAAKSGSNNIPPAVLQRITRMDDQTDMNVEFIGVHVNQASVDIIMQDRIAVPEKLMTDPDCAEYLRNDMMLIDRLTNLFYGVSPMRGKGDSGKKYPFEKAKELAPYARQRFLAETHQMLMGSYLPELESSDLTNNDDRRHLHETLAGHLRSIIDSVCDEADRRTANLINLKRMEECFRNVHIASAYILNEFCAEESGEQEA